MGELWDRLFGSSGDRTGDQVDTRTVTTTDMRLGDGRLAQEFYDSWCNQKLQATTNAGYTGYSPHSLRSQVSIYVGRTGLTSGVDPATSQPKTFPEESAAVAGFAAGIKHALNRVMGGNGRDPEKQRLYEEVMAEAVKIVLAPEASEELKKRALFRTREGSFRIVDMGELAPDIMTSGNVTFRRRNKEFSKDDDCPIVTYEEV